MKKPLLPPTTFKSPSTLSRRKFIGAAGAAASAFTILPRHVLGGPGYISPNEKISLAYIGCGTQGLREMLRMLTMPEVEIVAVCDPVKEGNNYIDFSRDGLRASIAEALGNADWRRAGGGIPGGREVAKEIIQTTYAKQRGKEQFKGCASYADFRELLAQEKQVNAVKIMTPDHLHATIAIAAMRAGKHTLMHKPLANRLHEARLVIDTARQTKVATHFLPANDGALISAIKKSIDSGAIGVLREIHNWSSRPMWPQYSSVPRDTPPIPEGFDWQLWLGPSVDRPYHSHFTHAVFRGWYEFGAGSIADMGHYSLWSVFRQFELDSPVSVESTPSHVCALDGNWSYTVKNDYSFPLACTVHFKFAAKQNRGPLDLYWYDGGMKPRTPEELESENRELAAEGMMFVGSQGKILAGFRGETPRILSTQNKRDIQPGPEGQRETQNREAAWVAAFRGGKPSYGDFTLAGPISDMMNLAAVSLRLGGRRLKFDSTNASITNVPEANKFLTRQYRPGWELKA